MEQGHSLFVYESLDSTNPNFYAKFSKINEIHADELGLNFIESYHRLSFQQMINGAHTTSFHHGSRKDLLSKLEIELSREEVSSQTQ